MKRTKEKVMADDDDDDDELKSRRERGRKAQQAFRNRQITTINELREQNQAMQAAIASLARVAGRIGRPELNDAVRNAQDAAGMERLEDKECYELEDETTDNPPQSQSTTLLKIGNLRVSGSSQFPSSSLARGLSSSSGHQQTLLQHRPCQGMPAQHQEPPANNEMQLGYQRGRMSPRLSYGIFLERPLFKLVNPPIDIVPWLEQDSSLASVVFWTSLVWGAKLLQAALEGNSQAIATADKVFGGITPMMPNRAVINGIQARLKYRRSGYIDSDHPGYDPDGGRRMLSFMTHTCAANGISLETYLRPDAAEEFVRNRLGAGYRVVELAIRGLGTLEDLASVHLLVNKMVRSSVCFGDGPRWKRDGLEKTVNSWVDSLAVPMENRD